MLTRPKISVLMAVYNGEKYLSTAIQSILNQTYRDFEFIIVDDGSTDTSRQIILSFPDPRIKLVENPSNLGLTESLNRGLATATGQYIARMDADDISFPERFQKQVAFLDTHPEIGVLGGGCVTIDEQGRTQKTILFWGEHDLILWYLCFQNPIVHPSVMVRTALLKQFHGYRVEFNHSEDYDLWWRMISQTRFANLQEPLIQLRWHTESITKRNQTKQRQLGHEIRREMIPKTFGKIDGLDLTTPDWKVALEVSKKVSYIEAMLNRMLRGDNLTAANKQIIRRDAADRLFIAGLLGFKQSGSWAAMARAVRLDAMVIGRVLLLLFSSPWTRVLLNPIVR